MNMINGKSEYQWQIDVIEAACKSADELREEMKKKAA